MGLLINGYAVRLICQVALGNLLQGSALFFEYGDYAAFAGHIKQIKSIVESKHIGIC